MDQSRYILWLKDVHKDDVAIVGGKGANLGEMYNAGFPVPPAFLVTTKAYFDFIERTGIRDRIKSILDETNVDDSENLRINAKRIQNLILTTQMPHYIREEIEKAYEALGLFGKEAVNLPHTIITSVKRESPFVAVRSSASAEDLPEASFAGQQATFLNVKGKENVVKAVQATWASLFTARAIFYREKNKFDHMKVGLCSIVQKMVESDKSGVGFSINPATNNPNEIVIEASYGLGEAIVSGAVTPDLYIVDKSTFQIIRKDVKDKKIMIKRDPLSGKNLKFQVPESKAKSQCLTDEEIINLARIIKRLEDHYNFPQDIEWAIEEGRLYIVQTRPVTTTKKEFKHEEIRPQGEIILRGLGSSPGYASGPVKIVKSLEDLSKVQKGDILVTKMTNPDMVPAMKRAAAIVTDEGGLTAHASIVSRELGIPAVVGTEKATEILKDGQIITVDAYNGVIYAGEVKPQEAPKLPESTTPTEVKEYYPTKTKIYMNLSVPDMIEKYKDLFFDGVGLMRIEFIIASIIKKHPLELINSSQEDVYINELVKGISKVASVIHPKPVIVRFSDFKTNEYKDLEGGEKYEPEERNPMLGWRGVSRYISPEFEKVFRLECKAIKVLRDSGLNNVHVMLPFVRKISEVRKALKIMEEEGLKREEGLKVYLMAEVPSVIFLADRFAELCDGFSIGSNDLTQLILGVDRDSELLAKRGYFDENNLAVKLAISYLIRKAHEKGKTVSICGQAPSEYPEFTRFLVEQGIDSISVNPDVVNSVRKLVHDVENNL